ncbi:permease component of an ABC superfamily arginine transporter [Hafnia paralvei ATCC 29927]|jgi:arginine transport system permease protein|uniref:Arginine ABC transporter permease protein ArtM n=2 Tax=Hafnia TaxID=568 RepID=A0A2A2MH12_9GAMM|nr:MULTISPECIES: arginine ABC transporter permease ArtM [Hafnia]AJQ98637.1 Arginine ABC transporter, permease protein ArtM [Enterobacteriaceae bacterium bta3-1]EFV42281.1 arginine ABC transporter permease ArtM [Enterobacteriaceae bacterium 9_2_54FAA]MDU1190531.1 arginine ABC transporter permease ArtM [Enterobacteriaceae bacterium]AMH19664.1 arginine transporter permease subunit ArtM [Hafnia paralvei]EHM38985.1 arginine ABC transporter permease protein ArtM [Hafnia alvei ATCC 51873]
MFEYIPDIIQGLPTSLSLTIISLLVALVLALLFTIVLTLRPVVLTQLVQGYITLFTGTPLLVQIFLIYYGPGQFDWIKQTPWLWNMLSQPWLCAMVALALNSAAYTTQLFYGAVKAIPSGQWQSCEALGMSRSQTLRILLPFAFKRALSSYSNEVVLIFKSTSLAYTITLMEVMGYSQQMYGRTYDVMVFGAAGVIYLCVNGLLTLIMRMVERRALAFERRN